MDSFLKHLEAIVLYSFDESNDHNLISFCFWTTPTNKCKLYICHLFYSLLVFSKYNPYFQSQVPADFYRFKISLFDNSKQMSHHKGIKIDILENSRLLNPKTETRDSLNNHLEYSGFINDLLWKVTHNSRLLNPRTETNDSSNE